MKSILTLAAFYLFFSLGASAQQVTPAEQVKNAKKPTQTVTRKSGTKKPIAKKKAIKPAKATSIYQEKTK